MIKIIIQKLNRFFLFIISLIFFIQSLQAEEVSISQNDLRKKKPIQISVFATGRSPKQNGFVDLHLGYNLRENLTLGISMYTLYPETISVQGFNRSVFEIYEKRNSINSKWQPIDLKHGHIFLQSPSSFLHTNL